MGKENTGRLWTCLFPFRIEIFMSGCLTKTILDYCLRILGQGWSGHREYGDGW